ncbi:hypothetical protein MXB_3643 [Myxobolus squamalis]|nr:hypothetical protein MXB_3643 [Myxobolus squamalis]
MRRRIIDNLREQHPNIDKTLFIFDSNNILRKSFGYILNFKYVNKVSSSSIGEILASQTYFEWIMIILTIASTILMMLETNENMVFDNFYTTIFEYCYVSINMIEVLMRMISQGLLLTPSAICNETSGVLNICTALIGLIHSIYFLGVSSCIENFTALLSGVPVSSNDPNYNSSAFSILVPRVVVGHSRFDFDNFLSAYLSSYIMMTLDSWTSGLDYVKQMVGSWVTLYFYAYVFFANLIGVSMFVGVVCQSYNINNGIALLTKDQRSWSDLTQRIDLTSPVFVPQRPLEKFRAILYDVATSFPYRIFHTLVICISPTALLIYALNDPDLHEEHYIIFIIIFACHIIFFIDIILKIISFGFITYFKGTVNKCDTLIIISMIISSALEIFTQYRDNVILSYVIISAITIELILLSTRWDALKDLMLTFIMSVVKSLTAITVMFIIMVTYSLIGNVLFGRLKFGLTTNRYFNYRTSFNALLILFILATGDNWSAYMLDSSIEPPFCTFDANAPIKTDCGSKIGAVIYFISYLLIIQQAILNLFIATVLSNFAVFCASDEINGRFKPSDITTYLTMWNKYDKQQNSEISRNYARMLCLEYFKLKQYTTTEDIYVLFQLYEQLDREIKAAYLNEDDQRADNDDFKKEGKISFRNLMLLLATKLANIKASFKTNDLLSKLALEEDITENVSATLIAKWYNYIKSYKKTGVLDVQNQTIRLQTDRLADNEILDAKKDESGLLKFDSDSLKRELEQIEQDSPTTNTEQIDEFCTWWHDRYLEAISSKKIN